MFFGKGFTSTGCSMAYFCHYVSLNGSRSFLWKNNKINYLCLKTENFGMKWKINNLSS